MMVLGKSDASYFEGVRILTCWMCAPEVGVLAIGYRTTMTEGLSTESSSVTTFPRTFISWAYFSVCISRRPGLNGRVRDSEGLIPKQCFYLLHDTPLETRGSPVKCREPSDKVFGFLQKDLIVLIVVDTGSCSTNCWTASL